MKKLIFLLIFAVALGGVLFAQDTAHPPGVFDLEAALYGDDADGRAVSPYTVLAALPVAAELSSFQAVMAIPFINTGQPWEACGLKEKTSEETDFYLLD